MTRLAIVAALGLTLTACTTAEMVGMAQNECAQIGYAPGTPEHTQCTERGYRNIDAQQDAAISGLAWWAVLEAAY